MKKIEIFGDKIDYLLPGAAAATLTYLYYGAVAAILTVVFILGLANLRYLHNLGISGRRLAIIGGGVALSLSIFFRSFFHYEYCGVAPWGVRRDFYDIGVGVYCFVRGGYIQYLFSDSWKSVLRDLAMPLSGLAIVGAALPPKYRRGGLSGLVLVLFLGLWWNAPLIRSGDEGSTPSPARDATSAPPAVPLISPLASGESRPAVGGPAASTFPAGLQGNWVPLEETCDVFNTRRLEISDTSFRHFELGVAEIKKAKSRPDGYWELELRREDAGYVWTQFIRPKGNLLEVDEEIDDGEFMTTEWKRCSVPLREASSPVVLQGDGLDACSNGRVVGLQADGDGYLAVRGRPSVNGSEVARLHNGDEVYACAAVGDWFGIVFTHSVQDCGVTTPRPQVPYSGPCDTGWVHRRWIEVYAG